MTMLLLAKALRDILAHVCLCTDLSSVARLIVWDVHVEKFIAVHPPIVCCYRRYFLACVSALFVEMCAKCARREIQCCPPSNRLLL